MRQLPNICTPALRSGLYLCTAAFVTNFLLQRGEIGKAWMSMKIHHKVPIVSFPNIKTQLTFKSRRHVRQGIQSVHLQITK